jgi:hypothetical protein
VFLHLAHEDMSFDHQQVARDAEMLVPLVLHLVNIVEIANDREYGLQMTAGESDRVPKGDAELTLEATS